MIRQIWCQEIVKLKTADIIKKNKYLINYHGQSRGNIILFYNSYKYQYRYIQGIAAKKMLDSYLNHIKNV